MANPYETDTYSWALDQVQRLGSGELIDVQNVAEEIEGLGNGRAPSWQTIWKRSSCTS